MTEVVPLLFGLGAGWVVVRTLPHAWWLRALAIAAPPLALASEAINGELAIGPGFLLVDVPEVLAAGAAVVVAWRVVGRRPNEATG
jgi:hypothetical protein